MKNVPDTVLGKLYKEHIQLILNKDIDGLLNHYTDDALLITSFTKEPLYYKGHEELREYMQGLLQIRGMETDIGFWAETENPQTLMIVESIRIQTDEGEARSRGAQSFVLRDGKIAVHFAGVVQYPDGSIA